MIKWKDYETKDTHEVVKAVMLTEENMLELTDYIRENITEDYTLVMPMSPQMDQTGGIILGKKDNGTATILPLGDYVVQEEDGTLLFYSILVFKREFTLVIDMSKDKGKEVPQFNQEIPSDFEQSIEKQLIDYLVANMPKPQTRQPMFNRREIVALELMKGAISNPEKVGLPQPTVFLDLAEAFLTECELRNHRDEI